MLINFINKPIYNKPAFQARIAAPKNLSKEVRTEILSGNISEHFVPTPEKIVNLMIQELGEVKATDRVLEPSAGYGHIAEALVRKTPLTPNKIDVIEPLEPFRKVLHQKGFNLVSYNILDYKPNEQYDKIIMNPPFDNGADILHTLHCYSLLKPKGKLVVILPENDFIPPRKSGYKKWMKDWFNNGEVKEINEYLHNLLETNESKVIKLGNAFKASDVPDDVKTRLVVITKK